MTINAKYYEAEIEYQKQMRLQYEASQEELQKQLTAMENAALRGTEEWYDAVEALNEVNSAITECDVSIADMNNSITDVANTIHEKLLSNLAGVSDEMDWITNLMSEMNMFNEIDGAFTKEGLATLGSYVSGMNTSKYSATLGKGLAEEMQKALDSNKLEFTFDKQTYKFNSIEQLKDAIKDANETWRDQITETYDYSNKIIDMMIQKLESELSALKELIDAKKEALDAEKDLHDYQKSIKKSTDDVASLQKQLAAIQGDTSEEGIMRIQKLQKELSDAQNDLNEKEYDRYISDQQDMLDKLMDEYESLINAETQNRDALLQKGIDAVKLSADSIKDTIDKYADKYDYTDVLDNIQSGLTTMTGTDSALEQIKTSVLSSIEPTGTLPTAINGINTNLSNIANLVKSILDASSKDPKTSSTANNSDSSNGANSSNIITPKQEEVKGVLTAKVYANNKSGATAYIKDNASKATKKKSEYSDVNKKVWDLTGGKVLSTSEMKELASIVGVTYNNAKKSGNLYKKLKSLKITGFSKGGVVPVDDIEKQVKANGDKVLVSANPGEGLLTPVQTELFEKFVGKLPELNQRPDIMPSSLISQPKMPDVQPVANMKVPNNIEATYNFTLENCTNADDILREIQQNNKIQKALKEVTVNRVLGGSRLGVNKIK